MSDNFASLGPSLLARKGGAKPAMRRQVGVLPGAGTAAQNLEDLGWNDMGEDVEEGATASYQRPADVLQLSPATSGSVDEADEPENEEELSTALETPLLAQKPNVLRQQQEIADRLVSGRSDAAPVASLNTAPVSKPEQTYQPVAEAAPEAEAVVPAPIAEPAPPPAAASRVNTARLVRNERKRRPALERGKRAAFTLRLDADRHLELRLACTLRGRSAQQLVTEALDQLLGNMNDVASLAAQVRGAD